MIVFLGDLHNADEGSVISAVFRADPNPTALVQVGDLEWWPDRPPPKYPVQMYFIDGNHDHLPSLLRLKEPTEVAPNLVYCPRGSTVQIDGRTIGFLGGGRSIDRDTRILGQSWFDDEEVRPEDVTPLRGRAIDILVTHTPPKSVVTAMLAGKGAPLHLDCSAALVEEIWIEIGRPQLVCGHMHRRYRGDRVLVLGDMDLEPL